MANSADYFAFSSSSSSNNKNERSRRIRRKAGTDSSSPSKSCSQSPLLKEKSEPTTTTVQLWEEEEMTPGDNNNNNNVPKSCLRLPIRRQTNKNRSPGRRRVPSSSSQPSDDKFALLQQQDHDAEIAPSYTMSTAAESPSTNDSRSGAGNSSPGFSSSAENDTDDAGSSNNNNNKSAADLLTPPTPTDRRAQRRQRLQLESIRELDQQARPLAMSSPEPQPSKPTTEPVHLLTPPTPTDRRPQRRQKQQSPESPVGMELLGEDMVDTPTRSNSQRSRPRGLYEGEMEPDGYRGQELQIPDALPDVTAPYIGSNTHLPPLKIYAATDEESKFHQMVSPMTPASAFWESGGQEQAQPPAPLSPLRTERQPNSAYQQQQQQQQQQQSYKLSSPESHLTNSTRSSTELRNMMISDEFMQAPRKSSKSRPTNHEPSFSSSSIQNQRKNRLHRYQTSNNFSNNNNNNPISVPSSSQTNSFSTIDNNTHSSSVELQQHNMMRGESSSSSSSFPRQPGRQQDLPSRHHDSRRTRYDISEKQQSTTHSNKQSRPRSLSRSSARSVASTKSSSTASSARSGRSGRSGFSSNDPEQQRIEKINAMASKHAEDGAYEQALSLLQQVLQFYKERCGKKHPRVASTHHNLGVVYSKKAFVMGHNEECIDLALANFQAAARGARDSLGPNHPNVATSLTKMGLLLLQERSERNAVQCFQEALRVRLVVYGPRHELVANLLNNIGVTFLQLGDLEESQKRFEQALDIQRLLVASATDERTSNSDKSVMHPFDEVRDRQLELADTLINMGGLALQRDSPNDAVRAFSEALDIRLKAMPKSDPMIVQTRALYDMARAKLKDSGGYEEASMPTRSLEKDLPPMSKNVYKRREEPPEEDWSALVVNEAASPPTKKPENVPLPLSEIVLSTNPETDEDDFDSVGEDSPQRRTPDGSTTILMSPHKISWSPTRNGKTVFALSSESDDSLLDKQKRVTSYEIEESCMIGAGNNRMSTFNPIIPTANGKAPHSIMVVQPSVEQHKQQTAKPLISKKTASWTKASNKDTETKYGSSPSLKLSADDSMYDLNADNPGFSDDAEHEYGLAPMSGRRLFADSDEIVLSQAMIENPGDHLAEIHYVASLYLKTNRLHEAIYLFETILLSQRQIHGSLHEDVGSAFHNVGVVYLRAERHDEALSMFEKAVRVRKGALGSQAPDVAVSLVKVGICNLLLHHFDTALIAFREALSVRRHSLGALHPSLARVYNNIGCVHVEFNEIREARRAFEGALDIQRSALCDEPENGALMFGAATTLSNLGYLYSSRNQHGKAALVLKEALTQLEMVLGPDHPTVLSTLDSLADSCARSNDCAVALKCYNEIIRRFGVLDDAEDESFIRKRRAEAVVLYKVSRVNRKQNDRESALENLEAALHAVRAINATARFEDGEASDRLERGIGQEIQQLKKEIAEAKTLPWV